MQWKLEVERVAPKLRLAVAADMQDWRRHLESAHSNVDALAASWPDARAGLYKLTTELSASLEKVSSREQQLNNQFSGLMMQYQDTRQQLITAQEDYNRWAHSSETPSGVGGSAFSARRLPALQQAT